MRIIFWGTPEYSVKSLEVLKKSEHDIVAVITQPDKKRSRGNKLISSPVKEYATKENIPVFTPVTIKENIQFISKLKDLSCDIFIVIAYGKILPKAILDIPKYKSWNAHASLLPRWRGAAPIQWSILEGDEFTGVGIMKMEEGLDTGDVLVEKQIKIANDPELLRDIKLLRVVGFTVTGCLLVGFATTGPSIAAAMPENVDSSSPTESLSMMFVPICSLNAMQRRPRMTKGVPTISFMKTPLLSIIRSVTSRRPRRK